MKKLKWYKTKYPGYFVSRCGKVMGPGRHGQPLILKPQNVTNGYHAYGISFYGDQKSIRAHKIIAEVFLGVKPINLVTNHKDGNKKNNQIKNLEYVTARQNIVHALDIGLSRHGERHHKNKLKKSQVIKIRKDKRTYREIAKQYGVHAGTISQIKSGLIWKRV